MLLLDIQPCLKCNLHIYSSLHVYNTFLNTMLFWWNVVGSEKSKRLKDEGLEEKTQGHLLYDTINL